MSANERRFLVLAPTGRDARLAQRQLEEAGLEAVICRDLDEMMAVYRDDGAAALLIAEEALSRDAVARLVALLADQKSWSDLPIILFTTAGVERRTGMLPQLGNVTLVDRPVRPITLISAARATLRARLRQYQAREALADQERAVRHRDQFLAMLGHELRNPLAAIQLATDTVEAGGDARRMEDVVRRQTGHLARLVDDLLDVSRVTSGKLVLHRQTVDLRQLVERGLAALEPQLGARRLALDLDLPDRPVLVDVDVVRMEQVLANLVNNSIKYTGPGGRIRVALDSEGDTALLTVADTGAGLAGDMLERVFELFAQADITLERSRGGLGIGLTLVRHLLELHGGGIAAHSPGPGKGSTFVARLPLADAVAVPEPTRSKPVAMPRAPAPIVLVEDHDDSRELLREILETYGHRVTATANGRAGVRAALAERPEIMIIDIGLPGLDGYTVARLVREELGDDVYLIALTGYGQPDDRRRATEAGFDVHVTKPVDFVALLDLLAHRRSPSPPPEAAPIAPP